MPTYAWEGKNRRRQTLKGKSKASSEAVLSLELRRKGIMPITIRPVKIEPFKLGLGGGGSVSFTRRSALR